MTQCVVLCGGYGSRLGHGVKTLRRVAGRPFIEHKLRSLARMNIMDVLLLCGPYLQEHLDQIHYCRTFGLNIEYWADESLGTGGAITQALPALAPTFWVTNGDALVLLPPLPEPEYVLGAALADLTVIEHPRSNVRVIDHSVAFYGEHPYVGATHLDYGMTACRWELFEHLPIEPYSFQHALAGAVHDGRVRATVVQAPLYHLNTPADLARTEKFLAHPTVR